MSENGMEIEESEVHFVYGGEGSQGYVLGKDESDPELRDIICADGSRAILVDGQYIVTDSQTILLESDANLTQYYINNDNSEGYVIDGEENSVNNLFESTEVLQLVEEDTNDGQQIIYLANEDNPQNQGVGEVAGVEGLQDEDGNIYPFKRIKLEGQMVNFDEFVEKQEGGLIDETSEENNGVQYAVMEDGSYEMWNESQPPIHEPHPETFDLSKITGRNLITGQTVTLHSYMEKLKKKLKNHSLHQQRTKPSKKIYNDEVRKADLSDLLDKKISIGKTKSGKKIVGKIIHIERKSSPTRELEEDDNLVISDQFRPETVESDATPPVDETNESDETVAAATEPTRILVRKYSVSKESFEQISKTLGGVMEMESVKKKLENKNIVVKLVEKRYVSESDSFVKNTSYSYGYMEKENEEINNEIVEKWKFVPDQDTQDVLLGVHVTSDNPEDGRDRTTETKTTRFPITTSLTIVVSFGKGGIKTIRVNLNPATGNVCTICAQYFKTNLQLRQHLNSAHHTFGLSCEVCEKSFDDVQKLQEHKNHHVQEGKLFICSECNKCFSSQSKLHKHLPTHDLFLKPLECSVCAVRCASEWALKKHLLTHTGIKPFSCDICSRQFLTQYDVNFHKKIHFPEKHFACNICLRTFSRHSNLLRHSEIHKGTGALYKCEICCCSYNYISSLTRHMVQNHIDATDFRKRIQKS